MTPEELRLKAEWPKTCNSCLARYTPASWQALTLATNHNAPDGKYTDAFGTFEMRNCTCGTTLVVLTQVHDLGAE